MTLEQAASKTAGCSVSFVGWLMNKESFGDSVCDGRVEMFERSSPPPRYVYGWTAKREGKEPEHVTALKVGNINSALAAVSAWLETSRLDTSV